MYFVHRCRLSFVFTSIYALRASCRGNVHSNDDGTDDDDDDDDVISGRSLVERLAG